MEILGLNETHPTLMLIVSSVILLYWYLTSNFNYWKSKGIPQEAPYSVVGHQATHYFKVCHEEDVKRYRRYGRIHGGYEGGSPFLFLANPELLKDVMVKDFTAFNGKQNIPSGEPIMDNMIHSMGGEDWKRMRRIIAPFFTSDNIKQHYNQTIENSKRLCRNISEVARAEKPFLCQRFFGAFVVDQILSIMLGISSDSLTDPNEGLIEKCNELGKHSWRHFINVSTNGLLTKMGIRTTSSIIRYFRHITIIFMKERHRGLKRKDYLQMLVDASKETLDKRYAIKEYDDDGQVTAVERNLTNGPLGVKRLTHDEVMAQCFMFLHAGYDSTKTTMSCVAYCLALNPECQERVIQEIDTAYKNNHMVDYDVILNMKYLDSIILETLRLYPPFVRLKRRTTQEYELRGTGIRLPKNMMILIPVYAIHHDEEFYPDPEKFCPERFMFEKKSNIVPCTYLSFGTGPRNCIGNLFAMMQMKTCFVNILRHYRFKCCTETQVPLNFNPGSCAISPKPIILTLEIRNDAYDAQTAV